MNISLAAEPLFHIGSFPVTNTLLVVWVIFLFVSVVAFKTKRSLKLVPGKLQNAMEAVIEYLINLTEGVVGDPVKARRFFPLAAAIFIAVILSNWVELIPGLGSIGLTEVHEGVPTIVPFIRSPSADLNFTLAIAVSSVIATQFFGIVALGFFKYAGKFFVPPWKKPYGIGTFLGIIELISEISKVISFSFRLFGNVFAGEVLLAVVSALVPYLVPLPFLFLEIFVGFVQALVFAMLTLVNLTIATTSHESHEERAPAH